MTKEQTTFIPEELYNLTQLAEVAAERLSTTDKIEANNNDSSVSLCNFMEKSMEPIRRVQEIHHHVVNVNGKPDVLTKDMKSLDQQQQQQQLQHNNNYNEEKQITEQTSIGITKAIDSTWKTLKKTENRSHSSSTIDDNYQQHHLHSVNSQDHCRFHPHFNYNHQHQHQHQQQHQHPHHHHQYNTTVMGTFYSSSDDDSNYYSHKVFDRKKLRRSTISDNSRYDEHSSCSSVAGSSGCSGSISGSSSSSSSSSGSTSGDEQLYSQSKSDDAAAERSSMHIGDLKQIQIDTNTGCSINILEDEHICPECGKKYSTSSNLARHRQTHRSVKILKEVP